MYNELGHYFLVLSIFVALTYNKRPAAVSLYFFFFTISFFGILFCYISSDFSNYNVFTNTNANAPLFYKCLVHGPITNVVRYDGVGS